MALHMLAIIVLNQLVVIDDQARRVVCRFHDGISLQSHRLPNFSPSFVSHGCLSVAQTPGNPLLFNCNAGAFIKPEQRPQGFRRKLRSGSPLGRSIGDLADRNEIVLIVASGPVVRLFFLTRSLGSPEVGEEAVV